MGRIEEELNIIVNDLLEDNDENDGQASGFDHPDKEEIIDILTSLRKIIFLGHFRNKSVKVYTSRNKLTMLLEDVAFKLTKQIKLVLGNEEKDEAAVADKAQEITFEFLRKLSKIREYIMTDVQAAYDGDPAAYSKDEVIYSYPGLFATLVNRIAHELYLLNVPVIPRMMTEYAHSETGIDIHPGASIGKFFFIDHGTGSVIGETTQIGDYVKIYQGVTLGALSTRGGQALRNKKRHPTIEDNVTIYSGASILGGDTLIGKGVVIGGNAFITRSIPEGAKVSVKSQELRYNYNVSKPVERITLEDDDTWFYII